MLLKRHTIFFMFPFLGPFIADVSFTMFNDVDELES